MLISLAILVVSVVALIIITLVLSNRLAVAKVQIHDVQEHFGIDLDGGLEKAISALEIIGQNSDEYVKQSIKGVISNLVVQSHNGGLFAPTIQPEKVDGTTLEWMQVELGQSQLNRRSKHYLFPSGILFYFVISHLVFVVNTSNNNLVDINSVVEQEFNALEKAGFSSWSCSPFECLQQQAHPIALYVGMGLRNTCSDLGLAMKDMYNFCTSVESNYNDVPYHCALHACDVVQATHCLMSRSSYKMRFTPLEAFAMIIAAAIHDVGHPVFSL